MASYPRCNPNKIIVHHIGGSDKNPLWDTSYQTFEDVNEYHKNAKTDEGYFKYHYGYPTSLGYYLAYNYFIDKNGKVTKAREDDERGAHTIGQNDSSIGICLAGNFDATLPTQAQTTALISLMRELMGKWNISVNNIYPHRKFANKSCFGHRLSDTWASDLVNEDPDTIQALQKQILDLIALLKSKLNGTYHMRYGIVMGMENNNNKNQRFGSVFSSSLAPEKLARTWQGIFAGIATFCGAVSALLALPIMAKIVAILGISVNPSDIADSWTLIATSVATFGSASFAFYGFIYKIFVAVYDKWLSKLRFFNKNLPQ